MLTNNEVLINNGDAASNITSDVLYLDQMFGFAIQAEITGAPVGTLKLQGSCDPGSPSPLNPHNGVGVIHWTDIADSQQAVTGAGSVVWNFDGAFYKWVRIVYTATSGTGNITARNNSKGV